MNPEQDRAVRHTDSPLLVLAGAGSGKTRVITHKIQYLIKELNIRPEKILAITFTRKAANEMQERIVSMLGVKPPWILTFHAFCLKLLRQEIERLDMGYSSNFVIYDEKDTLNIIKNIMHKLEWDFETPEFTRNNISKAKQIFIEDITPYDLLDQLGGIRKEIAKIFAQYQKELRSSNALDYDDLLYYATEILMRSPRAREKWGRAFEYILIDEYQDTNKVQYQLVQNLTATHKNVTIVGDPQQSVYSWRGANIDNILKFKKEFNPAVIKLEENYRSAPEILHLANKITGSMSAKWEEDILKLWTENSSKGTIKVTRFRHGNDENQYIAKTIKELVDEGYQYSDMAVLMRVSFLSRGLEETFLHSAIPCELIGGLEFFDRAEVKDMFSYLRLFSNSQDRVAFERVLNVPKRQLGTKTQILIEENYQKSWIQALHKTIPQLTPMQQAHAAEFIRIYKELAPNADAKPYTTLMQLVEELQYETYLEKTYKKDADGRIENVSELANLLKEAEDIGKSFSDFYDENLVTKSQQDDIDDTNKVKVLTCHSAKGLEWPIVFITAMEQNIFPHSKSLFNAEQTEEERRLFYVAVTRAKECLYITSSKKRQFWGNKVQSEISQFLELLKEEEAIEIEDLVDVEAKMLIEEAFEIFE